MKFTDDTLAMLDDRFGMFVHFGAYSQLGGVWKGEKVPGLGEWVMFNGRIPLAEYGRLAAAFVPETDWADRLAKAAKNAGMRYIVLTSKHHDGFCLFRSDYSVYNSWHLNGRDLVGELAEACRSNGLKLGLYYSHTLDWAERDGAGWKNAVGDKPLQHDNRWDYPDVESKDFERYFYGKAIPQVRELLTRYGDICCIWFDYPHNITPTQADELYGLVKSLAPHCLVSSRIAHGRGDYNSLGDNVIPTVPLGIPTECLVTLNDTWGYKSYDDNWKSPEEMTSLLARCVSSGTTLLMNVGPMGNGLLTPETYDILEKMGEWTRKNSEAVYGVRSNPFRCGFDWGYAAQSADSRSLYLYVKDRDVRELTLSGVSGEIAGVSELGGKTQKYSYDGGTLKITLDPSENAVPAVYKVSFVCRPVIADGLIQCGDVLALNCFYGTKCQSDGTPRELPLEANTYDTLCGKQGIAVSMTDTVNGWDSAGEFLRWDAEFTEAGSYECELSVSAFKAGGGEFTVSVGKDVRSALITPESASRTFQLSRTKSGNVRLVYSFGKFDIPSPGRYTVELHRLADGDNLPLTEVRFVKG